MSKEFDYTAQMPQNTTWAKWFNGFSIIASISNPKVEKYWNCHGALIISEKWNVKILIDNTGEYEVWQDNVFISKGFLSVLGVMLFYDEAQKAARNHDISPFEVNEIAANSCVKHLQFEPINLHRLEVHYIVKDAFVKLRKEYNLN